jgi:hypothetical protein
MRLELIKNIVDLTMFFINETISMAVTAVGAMATLGCKISTIG